MFDMTFLRCENIDSSVQYACAINGPDIVITWFTLRPVILFPNMTEICQYLPTGHIKSIIVCRCFPLLHATNTLCTALNFMPIK